MRENISLWEGVLVLKGHCIHEQREQATITALRENISLWEGVLVLKGQYTERASHNNSFEREYFTLGVCAGLKRPIHTSRENKLHIEYFTLGACAGLKRPVHMSRENKLQ